MAGVFVFCAAALICLLALGLFLWTGYMVSRLRSDLAELVLRRGSALEERAAQSHLIYVPVQAELADQMREFSQPVQIRFVPDIAGHPLLRQMEVTAVEYVRSPAEL
jgi:hypothetical protein